MFFFGGDSRAEYLRKKHYFKCVGEHCYLQPWNYGNQFVKGGITLGLHFFIFEAVMLACEFSFITLAFGRVFLYNLLYIILCTKKGKEPISFSCIFEKGA